VLQRLIRAIKPKGMLYMHLHAVRNGRVITEVNVEELLKKGKNAEMDNK